MIISAYVELTNGESIHISDLVSLNVTDTKTILIGKFEDEVHVIENNNISEINIQN